MESDDEVKGEKNSYITDYRVLDPRLGRWLSLDPKAKSMPWQSPYCSMDNSPILLMDPYGDSTFVEKLSNGKYKVIGGNLAGNHNGIFVKNSEGKIGEMIGYSLTPYSFYNPDVKSKEGAGTWMGTIDVNDQTGNKFVDEIYSKQPKLIEYMGNATGGKKYDFKRTNGTVKQIYDKSEDFYRGMPFQGDVYGQKVFASARDIGNYVAGYMASVCGLKWEEARTGFDLLESYQKNKAATETESTQYGQAAGFAMGLIDSKRFKIYNYCKKSGDDWKKHVPKKPKAILIMKNAFLIKSY